MELSGMSIKIILSRLSELFQTLTNDVMTVCRTNTFEHTPPSLWQ